MSLNPADFEYITQLVRDRAGIVLESGKEYLVESRVMPLVHQEKLGSIADLVQTLKSKSVNSLHEKVVEAMTTNETSFFRDVHPFETLKNSIIPELLDKRKHLRELNIWCGASSSGQEPYSLALLIRENFPELATWKINFIASDISQFMLNRCRSGLYSQLEINRGLPASYLVKHFERNGTEWQIKAEFRKMIDFRFLNLSGEWPSMPTMDLIMMRNVLIYFDTDMKKRILLKVRNMLKPDGYLFLGAAETTLNLDDTFERMNFKQSGCYRIRPS